MLNYTPLSLWKDFDPTKQPLDAHILKTTENDGVSVSWYTFCGRMIEKQSSRVLVAVAQKIRFKSPQPIIVVIDPFNRIDTQQLIYWAKLGYTALSIDYLGESDEHEGLMTIYPFLLDYSNYNKAKQNLKSVEYDAQRTCWYEWTLNTRRALTFAQTLNNVNPQKIGLFSVCQGNIIAVMTLAMDNRVKAGAVLYGNLWEDVEPINTSNLNNTAKTDELTFKVEQSRSNDEWLAAISPQSYLSYIKQPFYTCVGTNSTNTDMDKTYDCLLRMGNNKCGTVLFAPRMMDSMPSNYTSNLEKWFSVQLNDDNNSFLNVDFTISAVCRQGQIYIQANSKIGDYQKAVLYYSRNRVGTESSRNYVEEEMDYHDDCLCAPLSLYSLDTPIVAFCNLTFKNGVNVSSNLLKFIPNKLFSQEQLKLERRSPIVYDNKQGLAEFTTMNINGTQTTEFIDKHPLAVTTGAYAISGICGTNMGSFVVCDDKITYSENSLLMLDAYSRTEQELNIYLIYNWGEDNQTEYKHTVKLTGGDVWQKIVLNAQDFKEVNTNKPAIMEDIRAIYFSSTSEIILNNILFT